MDKKEIKIYVGKLLNILHIKNSEITRIEDFVQRLKDNDQTDYDDQYYEKMQERDKYLKEEIDTFLSNNK